MLTSLSVFQQEEAWEVQYQEEFLRHLVPLSRNPDDFQKPLECWEHACEWSFLVYSPSSWPKEDSRIVNAIFCVQICVLDPGNLIFFFICKVHDLTTTRSVLLLWKFTSQVFVAFGSFFQDSHDLSAHFAVLKEKKIITWAVITYWWYLYTGCWIIMNSTPPQRKVVLTQTAAGRINY